MVNSNCCTNTSVIQSCLLIYFCCTLNVRNITLDPCLLHENSLIIIIIVAVVIVVNRILLSVVVMALIKRQSNADNVLPCTNKCGGLKAPHLL